MSSNGRPMQEIPITRITCSRWQPRDAHFNEERLLGLARSIEENGLLQPVVVFVNERGDYELVAGERRVRALLAIYWSRLPDGPGLEEAVSSLAEEGPSAVDGVRDRIAGSIRAIIEPGDDMERLHRFAVIENLERESLSPVEEATALQGLMEAYGWSQRQLAEALGKSQGWISQRLLLLALSPAARKAVNTRVIGITEARALATMPEALQPAVVRWVQQDDVPARDVERRLRWLAAFLNPDRWTPNQERVYSPSERNLLAMLKWAIQNADLTTRTEAILALADGGGGYYHQNLLKAPPSKVIGDRYAIARILEALGYEPRMFWNNVYAPQVGKTCETCLWATLDVGEVSARHYDLVTCPRQRKQAVDSCLNWQSRDSDPPMYVLAGTLVYVYSKQGWSFESAPGGGCYVTNKEQYIENLRRAVQIRDASAQEQEDVHRACSCRSAYSIPPGGK